MTSATPSLAPGRLRVSSPRRLHTSSWRSWAASSASSRSPSVTTKTQAPRSGTSAYANPGATEAQ